MMTSEEVYETARNSSFNRSHYHADVSLDYIRNSMMMYTSYENHDSKSEISLDALIKNATPEFQRSNDQWTVPMKIKFVENVLCGYRTDILFSRIGRYSDAKILDGLQRLTAISDFLNERIKVFGDTSLLTIMESNVIKGASIGFKIYTFENEKDPIRFYIDMNENITHSPSDIEKARAFL